MSETLSAPSKPRSRGLWRKLLYAAAAVVLLLVIAYLVATSSPFFRQVILPRVSAALHATVTVDQASLHPFSRVVLRGLKVQTTGTDPLLSAEEVRVRYSLWSILRGTIRVDEMLIQTPSILIVQEADGSSNLDPILHSPGPQKTPEAPSAPPTPMQIDIKKVAFQNARIRLLTRQSGGGRTVQEVSKASFVWSDLKNGQSGKIDFSSDLHYRAEGGGGPTNALASANLTGSYTLGLGPDLMPSSVQGESRLVVSEARGAVGDWANLQANLVCEAGPKEIKQVAFRFKKGPTDLGEISLAGPFDLAQGEGQVNLVIRGIDRQLLNLLGGLGGWDFGSTRLSSTNQISVAKGGRLLTVRGRLDVASATLGQGEKVTPVLGLQMDYDLAQDQAARSVLFRALTLHGTQNQRPVLRAGLTGPMQIAWANSTNAIGDSRLSILLTNVDLAEWKPFLRELSPEGQVDLGLSLESRESGGLVGFDLNARVVGLSVALGSNRLSRADLGLALVGRVKSLTEIHLTQGQYTLSQAAQPLLKLSVAGPYDLKTGQANLQVNCEAALDRLLAWAPQPDLALSAGTLAGNGHWVYQQQSGVLTGQVALTNLTGRYAEYTFQDYATALDLEVQTENTEFNIRKADLAFTSHKQPGGHLRAEGSFDQAKRTGMVTLRLEDLNGHALRPFLQSMLPGQEVVSVSLQGTNIVQVHSPEQVALRSDVQLSRLVLRNPRTNAAEKPLAVAWRVDAQMTGRELELRPSQLILSPTSRAKNELSLQGRLNMAPSNAWEGQFRLEGAALDVTQLYEWVSGFSSPTNQPVTSPAPPPDQPPPPLGPATEPDPVTLPCRHLGFDARLERLYLGQLDLANLQARAVVESNRVRLNPLEFRLNDRPVSGRFEVDLGVPGYVYDLSLRLENLLLGPMVKTFNPEYRDSVQGELWADMRIKGAGVTDINLHKNLASTMAFGITNANLNLLDMPPVMKPLQAFFDKIGVQKALQFLVQQQGMQQFMQAYRPAWLTNSVLHWMAAEANVAQGELHLRRLPVVGEYFALESTGRIPLRTNLLSSVIPNVPVQFSLSRSLAEKLRLLPADSPPEMAYIPVPQFFSEGGTLGKPEPKFDVANLLLKTGLRVLSDSKEVEKLKKKLDEKLPGASQLLDLDKRAGTNAPGGSNTVDKVLRNLGGFLGGDKSRPRTNAPVPVPPGGTTPKPPNP